MSATIYREKNDIEATDVIRYFRHRSITTAQYSIVAGGEYNGDKSQLSSGHSATSFALCNAPARLTIATVLIFTASHGLSLILSVYIATTYA